MDKIHEYLLLKGVECVAIHGGKDQEDRMSACRAFRGGEKDVLVATDIASKGLDFPDIMHVINYDMPEDIENYIHRIGRTGRGNNTGVATTFVNSKSCDKSILLDLKGTIIVSVPKTHLYYRFCSEFRQASTNTGPARRNWKLATFIRVIPAIVIL